MEMAYEWAKKLFLMGGLSLLSSLSLIGMNKRDFEPKPTITWASNNTPTIPTSFNVTMRTQDQNFVGQLHRDALSNYIQIQQQKQQQQQKLKEEFILKQLAQKRLSAQQHYTKFINAQQQHIRARQHLPLHISPINTHGIVTQKTHKMLDIMRIDHAQFHKQYAKTPVQQQAYNEILFIVKTACKDYKKCGYAEYSYNGKKIGTAENAYGRNCKAVVRMAALANAMNMLGDTETANKIIDACYAQIRFNRAANQLYADDISKLCQAINEWELHAKLLPDQKHNVFKMSDALISIMRNSSLMPHSRREFKHIYDLVEKHYARQTPEIKAEYLGYAYIARLLDETQAISGTLGSSTLGHIDKSSLRYLNALINNGKDFAQGKSGSQIAGIIGLIPYTGAERIQQVLAIADTRVVLNTSSNKFDTWTSIKDLPVKRVETILREQDQIRLKTEVKSQTEHSKAMYRNLLQETALTQKNNGLVKRLTDRCAALQETEKANFELTQKTYFLSNNSKKLIESHASVPSNYTLLEGTGIQHQVHKELLSIIDNVANLCEKFSDNKAFKEFARDTTSLVDRCINLNRTGNINDASVLTDICHEKIQGLTLFSQTYEKLATLNPTVPQQEIAQQSYSIVEKALLGIKETVLFAEKTAGFHINNAGKTVQNYLKNQITSYTKRAEQLEKAGRFDEALICREQIFAHNATLSTLKTVYKFAQGFYDGPRAMAHSAYHNPQEAAVAGLKTIAIVNALCNPNPVGQAYAMHELYQGYKNLISYLASCPADTLAYELGKLAGQTTVTATSLHGVSKICLNSAQKFQQASQAVRNQSTKIHILTDNEILQLAPNIIEARVIGTAADGTPIYGLTEPTPLPGTAAGPSSLPAISQPQLTTSTIAGPSASTTTVLATTESVMPALTTAQLPVLPILSESLVAVPDQLVSANQVATTSEITQPANQLVPEKITLVINEINDLLTKVDVQKYNIDLQELKIAMQKFANVKGAFENDGCFDRIKTVLNKSIHNVSEGGDPKLINGSWGEIRAALEIDRRGYRIIEFGQKLKGKNSLDIDLMIENATTKQKIAVEIKNYSTWTPEIFVKFQNQIEKIYKETILHDMGHHIVFLQPIPDYVRAYLIKKQYSFEVMQR